VPRALVEVRGLPLNHDETVVEWGTQGFGWLMTGPPAMVEDEPWDRDTRRPPDAKTGRFRLELVRHVGRRVTGVQL
jgi:hypothetical protein